VCSDKQSGTTGNEDIRRERKLFPNQPRIRKVSQDKGKRKENRIRGEVSAVASPTRRFHRQISKGVEKEGKRGGFLP